MEAAAENERGRGRPPRFSAELMRRAAADGPRSRHGQQDRIYAQLAIAEIKTKYLEPDERTRWLFDEERMTAKWTLLTELGRLRAQRGEENFHRAAEWILRDRPKVKPAVKRIRALRTGKPPPGPDPDATARAIMELLDPFPEHEAYRILGRLLVTYRQVDGPGLA